MLAGVRLAWAGFGLVGVVSLLVIVFWPATAGETEGAQLTVVLFVFSVFFFPPSSFLCLSGGRPRAVS